jgi:hypothetical protein
MLTGKTVLALHVHVPSLFAHSLLAAAATAAAGIIGAKNQGSGVAGVVPGMPIIAFKVLGRDGSGPLDGIYR